MNPLFIQQRLDVTELSSAKDKMVLDAGTGKGRFAISFALASVREVKAIDISKAMLLIASKRAKMCGVANRVIFEQGDVEKLKYPDECFDIVCCMETFVHLPNPLKAMKELTRVCKIGGTFIADATNNNPLWRQYYPARSTPPVRRAIYRSLRPLYYWKPACVLRLIGRRYFNTPREKTAKPYYRHYSRIEFLQLFVNASLKIEQILEYGTPIPVLFLVLARKVGHRQ